MQTTREGLDIRLHNSCQPPEALLELSPGVGCKLRVTVYANPTKEVPGT